MFRYYIYNRENNLYFAFEYKKISDEETGEINSTFAIGPAQLVTIEGFDNLVFKFSWFLPTGERDIEFHHNNDDAFSISTHNKNWYTFSLVGKKKIILEKNGEEFEGKLFKTLTPMLRLYPQLSAHTQ